MTREEALSIFSKLKIDDICSACDAHDDSFSCSECGEAFLLAMEALKQPEIVRCKDCEHRGNSEKCVLSAISEEKDFPLFMLDNRGEWFCADGKRKDT